MKRWLVVWPVVAPVLWLVTVSTGWAQVSPGPLSQAHADLEGATNCLKCHASGTGAMDQRCRECHTEIEFQVTRGLGLHGQESKTECAQCHPDHAGREFELIHWEEGSAEKFDHGRTGWLLEGKHATLECSRCHKAEFQSGEIVGLLKRKDPGESWLGLSRDCLSCHDDYHRGTLPTECVSCHDLQSWKPAGRFDHDRSSFRLTGKHTDLGCEKCHLVPDKVWLDDGRGGTVPRYKPVPHAECSDCHRDPHNGQLGPVCASCHVTTDFKSVDRKQFDHAKTRYPLTGKHRNVACAECHDPQRAWGQKPPFATCDACHTDAHAGKATLAGVKADCAACHDVDGFKPSTYTIARHRESDYPLEGKHETVRCELCHTKNPAGVSASTLGEARVLIRPPHAQCRDCHRDLHQGQLDHRADGGACESCHRVDGWKPSTYTSAQHAELEFALDGKHTQTECASCHGPERKDLAPLPDENRLGEARVALTLVESECASCHFDPHGGRFASGGADPMPNGCKSCHDARSFVPSTVDTDTHREFGYALEGAHRAVPCILCHEELKLDPAEIHLLRIAGAVRALRFEAKHERCEDCHSSPHRGQFDRRADGGRCDGCHVVEAWRPAERFDHERDADFRLEGAHRSVPCERCHRPELDADGAPYVVYRPIPKQCRDCHGRNIPRRSS